MNGGEWLLAVRPLDFLIRSSMPNVEKNSTNSKKLLTLGSDQGIMSPSRMRQDNLPVRVDRKKDETIQVDPKGSEQRKKFLTFRTRLGIMMASRARG